MRKNKNIIDDVVDEIRAKYHRPSVTMPTGYATRTNLVVDSLFPDIYWRQLRQEDVSTRLRTMDSRAVAISPFIANELGVRQMDTEEMIKVLGHSKTGLGRLMSEVKRKKIGIALIGLGGTGANFLHWMEELCAMTDMEYIFDTIDVFDGDHWSLSNLPRIPMDMSRFRIPVIEKIRALESNNVARTMGGHNYFVDESLLFHFSSNTVAYGAPDIVARKMLSESETLFVSATHQDDVCSLDLNPVQSVNLQVEAYGKVDLAPFFMNHLQMTIEFMAFLAATDLENISKTESAKIMDFSFVPDEYNTTRRTYRFPKGYK